MNAAQSGRRRPLGRSRLRRGLTAAAALSTGALIALPLAAVFTFSLRDGAAAYWRHLTTPDSLHALQLTLLASGIAVPVSTVFGLAAAWAVAKFQFPGRRLLTSIIELPLSLSPILFGVAYLFVFGMQGLLGPWLDEHGLQLAFNVPALVIITALVTAPYVFREILPLMQTQGTDEELAAVTLGAGAWSTFWRVTLPNIRWALLYGVTLCFARSLGEFGAVAVVSGAVRGETNTLTLHIELLANDRSAAASFAVASVLTSIALVTLVVKSWAETRSAATSSPLRILMSHPAELVAYLRTLPFLGRATLSQSEVTAGEWVELVLTYEVGASGFADGGWLKVAFKFYSDWALFQTTSPGAANYVSAEYHARPVFPGESPATVRSLKVRFDQKGHERPYQKAILVDVVDGYLKPGDRIVLRLGDRRHGAPGTRAQTFAEEASRFRVFVDTVGASRFAAVPDDLVLSVRPGAPRSIRLITPRTVRPGVAFPITASSEDVWGNATEDANFPRQLVIRDDQGNEVQRTPLTPKSGSRTWARIHTSITKTGTYLLEVGDARARIDVRAELPTPRALFADLHIHSEDTVGVNTTADVLGLARDAAGLDIAGYTANDFNVRADRWARAVEVCRDLHREGEFLCFPGTEWCGASAVGGDRNVIFLGEEVRFPLDRDGRSLRVFDWNEDTSARQALTADVSTAKALHDAYRDLAADDRVLLIPHVGGRRSLPEWHDPDLERLVEVASSWGHFDWFYREALAQGLQVGASAAGDEHRGRPGGGAPGVGSFGVHGGLTGIWCDELTSQAVARALRARHTWATTGQRAVAHLFSGKHRQGDAFVHRGPLPVSYRLFAAGVWERVELRDDQGTLVHGRDFHRELGYSRNRFRVVWGGARIRDRYRWAEWRGTLEFRSVAVRSWITRGFEHLEETLHREEAGLFTLRTDTYGDADQIEFEVDDLAFLELHATFEIDAFNKTGDPLARNLDPVTPGLSRRVTGEELLSASSIRVELGGAGLFVAFERVTDQPLPSTVEETVTLTPANGPHGHRALYLHAREQSDAKLWTSPLFVTLQP